MRSEQVALPILRFIHQRPRLSPVLDRLLAPYNPFDPQLDVDPYPTYERLRERGPIWWHGRMNTWVVTSYELCEEVLRSPVASVDRGTEVARTVEAAGAGIAVPPDDAEAFTKAVASLVERPADAAEMGAAGRRFVERWASPAGVAEAYERLFAELAAT